MRTRLEKAGYYEAATTPGLWRHRWRPIQFVLLLDNFGNISIHRYAAGPIGVPGIIIPSEVDSCKFCSFPVCGDLVVFPESLQEMEGVFFAHIFDAEVVKK